MSSIFCKNCQQEFDGNYCPNCGQSAKEHRINATYFLHDIPHSIFHIDGLFFSTLKGLFTKPGLVVQEFLEGKRVKYFRPFAYVMVMTAISTLLVKFLIFCKEKMLLYYQPNLQLVESHNFFEHYFSLFIFMMIPFAGLVTWLFFYRNQYNYWEHFLANTYIAAQLNFIWIFIHLITLILILFKKQYFELDFNIFILFS